MPGAITLSLFLLAGASADQTPPRQETAVSNPVARPAAPARLPWARGRSFATLDAYLAYLERYNGPIDLPWWREIRPGVYEKVVRMPEGKREIVTRAELERRWSFAPVR